jgi:ADP-heptose:LPS heptosyltransferase
MNRRVLVARLDSIGDVLVSGPAVRAVAAAAEVLLLCGPAGEPAARILPGPARVAVWECPWILSPAPTPTAQLIDRLTRIVLEFAPDEAVILTSFHQSPLPLALLLRLAGVPRITGASVDYAGSLLDVRLRPGEDLDEDQPEPLRGLAIAGAAGFRLPPGDDGGLRVLPPPDVRHLVGEEPYAVVHPGANVPARAWPAVNAARAVALFAERGMPVVVTGEPRERELTRAVAGSSGLDLGGRTDLAALGGVLRGAAVVVVGNTGPAHLAAAVGAPVVSLFSPVVPASRWRPYGTPVTLLGDQDAPCRGSRSRECPVPGHPCLADVTPDAVVDAALALAAEARTGNRAGSAGGGAPCASR